MSLVEPGGALRASHRSDTDQLSLPPSDASNRFHKDSETGPAIQRLRELHDEMDRAVLRAYGWDDLADTVQPEFLTEETEDDHTYQGRYFWPAAQRDLVFSRLLALNAERYKEEVAAGLHEKSRKRAKADEGENELEIGE